MLEEAKEEGVVRLSAAVGLPVYGLCLFPYLGVSGLADRKETEGFVG